jgi:hypothetical protein
LWFEGSPGKQFARPSLKKKSLQKKGWQSGSTEFKPQHRKKEKKKTEKNLLWPFHRQPLVTT